MLFTGTHLNKKINGGEIIMEWLKAILEKAKIEDGKLDIDE